MVTKRVKLNAAVLLSSLLFLSFACASPALAISVELTNGKLAGRSGLGTIDVAGPGAAMTGSVEILDLIGVTDCVQCLPGHPFNSFWSFDLFNGTLTLQGVDHSLSHEQVSGHMSGSTILLPTESGTFQVQIPFTLSISVPEFDLVANGAGVQPVTISCDIDAGVCLVAAHVYFVGALVPEPNSLWLLLGGLPALVGVGWRVRRSR